MERHAGYDGTMALIPAIAKTCIRSGTNIPSQEGDEAMTTDS